MDELIRKWKLELAELQFLKLLSVALEKFVQADEYRFQQEIIQRKLIEVLEVLNKEKHERENNS